MSLTSLRAKGVLGALALVVLGAVAGVAIDRALMHHRVLDHGPADHGALVAALQAELDLDDHQLHEVHAILQHHRERVEHAWSSVRPEVQAAIDSIELQVLAVLRPDQRERFRAWFARHHPEEHEEPEEHQEGDED